MKGKAVGGSGRETDKGRWEERHLKGKGRDKDDGKGEERQMKEREER